MADFDLFAQLQEFQWRSIGFPATTFKVSLRQDLAKHLFADRDGGHIEATGRAPLQFTAHIPFINTIVPGPAETWASSGNANPNGLDQARSQTNLYPDQFRAFFAACAERSTGVLQHPELGKLNCKVESLDVTWAADARAGVFVDVAWIENTFTPEDSNEVISRQSPVSDASLAAFDLDADIETITPDVPELPEFQAGFGDMMRSIRAVSDQVGLLARRSGGVVDEYQYHTDALIDSISTAKTQVVNGSTKTILRSRDGSTATIDGPSVLLWPLRDAAERARSATQTLRETLLGSRKSIGLYPVKREATLAAISVDIPAPIADVIRLNPPLVAGPLVPAGTIVKYFLAA